MTTISILVCAYNAQEYISQCLDSLLTQTFHDIEIIIVDDGSTDETPNILASYATKHPIIRVLHQKNAGPGVARNLALSHAKGKYIMFCDSDDWYEPTMCEKMYSCINSNNVDLVCCNCVLEYKGNSFGRDKHRLDYHYLKFEGKREISLDTKKLINSVLWNKIFKKELIDQFNISFPAIREHDDDSFVSQYLYVARSVWGLMSPLYHYRLREKSIMAIYWQEPQKADKWTHLQSWQHTGFFLIKQLKKSTLPIDYIGQFFASMRLMQQVFSWKTLSEKDKSIIKNFIKDLPFNSHVSAEYPLYLAQRGNFDVLEQALRVDKQIFSLGKIILWRQERTWREKYLFVLGIEIYKRDYFKRKIRLFGIIKIRI
ncbi:MAG: glycosyltransferase family 2 protein [Elusimicrobiaceae bacterium]|nr:glycosyltransferase family 2 protein [Elusimicrobiaceae bacterium]